MVEKGMEYLLMVNPSRNYAEFLKFIIPFPVFANMRTI